MIVKVMKRVSVNKLKGAALDWAVAKCEGWVDFPTDSMDEGRSWFIDPERAPWGRTTPKSEFQPSTNWAQGMPIVDREKIEVHPGKNGWSAFDPDEGDWFDGPEYLVAAMRCYVAMNLGKTVMIQSKGSDDCGSDD